MTTRKTILVGIFLAALALIVYGGVSLYNSNQTHSTIPVSSFQDAATATPEITLSPVQVQATYQASTTIMTVEQLDARAWHKPK